MSVNLATFLTRDGSKVALVDADLGLANAHLMLGVSPQTHLLHLLREDATLEDVLIDTPSGVRLISGGSGVREVAALGTEDLFLLIRKLEKLRQSHDYVVIDTSAGLGPQTLMFLYAAREILLVTTPDLTSMTDAYAIAKTLVASRADFKVQWLVNRCVDGAQAEKVLEKLRGVTSRFLDTRLDEIGFLHEDRNARKALAERRPIVELQPRCRLSRGLTLIGRRVRDRGGSSTELPHAVRQVAPDAVAPDVSASVRSTGSPAAVSPTGPHSNGERTSWD